MYEGYTVHRDHGEICKGYIKACDTPLLRFPLNKPCQEGPCRKDRNRIGFRV